MAAKTARIARTALPLPRPADSEQGHGGELDAIQALYNAYMALNATGTDMSVGWTPSTPMQITARAARAALAMLPGVSARDARIIWDEMCDNGSGAQWNYNLWRDGEI